eukprot:jgi/Tetstr1/447264/TSEL_034701.t1
MGVIEETIGVAVFALAVLVATMLDTGRPVRDRVERNANTVSESRGYDGDPPPDEPKFSVRTVVSNLEGSGPLDMFPEPASASESKSKRKDILMWEDLRDRPDLVLEYIQKARKKEGLRVYFHSTFKPGSEFTFEIFDNPNRDPPPDENINQTQRGTEETWQQVLDKMDIEKNGAVVFKSPSGADLVVPKSGKNKDFLDFFQSPDIDANEKKVMLNAIFETALKRFDRKEVYVITDGNQIDWLHVRVQDDDRHARGHPRNRIRLTPEAQKVLDQGGDEAARLLQKINQVETRAREGTQFSDRDVMDADGNTVNVGGGAGFGEVAATVFTGMALVVVSAVSGV